jgi:hypothetical protein
MNLHLRPTSTVHQLITGLRSRICVTFNSDRIQIQIQESIIWNRFLDSLKVYKFGLCFTVKCVTGSSLYLNVDPDPDPHQSVRNDL